MDSDTAHTHQTHPHVSHMVLSGGGLSGISYVGIFRFLEVEKMRQHIRHVAGSSAGALLGTMFALGYSSEEMERRIKDYVCKVPVEFPLADIWSIFSKYGIDDGYKFIGFVLEDLGNVTFLDLLKRTGIHLVICATHVATLQATFFSAERTPNVCVKDALRASTAIPWFVCPVKIGEDYYIDGSVSANIPIDVFEDVDPSCILMGVLDVFHRTCDEDPMSSPYHFTYSILNRFMLQSSLYKWYKEKYSNMVWMRECPVGFMPITADKTTIRLLLEEKEIDDAITYGYEVIHDHYFGKQV